MALLRETRRTLWRPMCGSKQHTTINWNDHQDSGERNRKDMPQWWWVWDVRWISIWVVNLHLIWNVRHRRYLHCSFYLGGRWGEDHQKWMSRRKVSRTLGLTMDWIGCEMGRWSNKFCRWDLLGLVRWFIKWIIIRIDILRYICILLRPMVGPLFVFERKSGTIKGLFQ